MSTTKRKEDSNGKYREQKILLSLLNKLIKEELDTIKKYYNINGNK